jgi:hypothetical protein
MTPNTIGHLVASALVCGGLFFGLVTPPARGQALEWVRQFGTASSETGHGVSADDLGNVYISGITFGSLGGPHAGNGDAFISKYDAAGTLQWTRQLGTTLQDSSSSISADGLGNVYISGETGGSLDGPNAGPGDVFISKYDGTGNLQWTKQIGTNGDDDSNGVSADGLGNVFISGQTTGSLGGPFGGCFNPGAFRDAFISKYDAEGNLQWTKQLTTAEQDESHGVSADGLGNVYISGYTGGSVGGPNAGGWDAFISKYDAAGNLEWSRQLGTAGVEESFGVSADGLVVSDVCFSV